MGRQQYQIGFNGFLGLQTRPRQTERLATGFLFTLPQGKGVALGTEELRLVLWQHKLIFAIWSHCHQLSTNIHVRKAV